VEARHGVSGYRNTQDAIESVSTMKSEFDSMKGRTLEDMSDMVQQFNSKIASKKAALEPIIRELRSVRQQAQVVTTTFSQTHHQPFNQLFNGPFSGNTQVSRYQKGKDNLDFTEARDSEWQWHQLGHMQVCTPLQTDNHASTPPLSFLQAGCPSCRPTNSVKALKQSTQTHMSDYYFVTESEVLYIFICQLCVSVLCKKNSITAALLRQPRSCLERA